MNFQSACDIYNEAFRAFSAARDNYRQWITGDAEFEEAHATYKKASAEFDTATLQCWSVN